MGTLNGIRELATDHRPRAPILKNPWRPPAIQVGWKVVDDPSSKPMNTTSDTTTALAEKITQMELKLEALEQEIAEIGQPAANDLKKRFDALRIEEKALKRNFEESTSRGEPDSVRLAKVEALLHYMQGEESSVEHEAHFLHQAAPSSVTIAAQAVSGLIDLYRKAIHRVVGDSHPLGQSVFVNQSTDELAAEYGLETPPAAKSSPENP